MAKTHKRVLSLVLSLVMVLSLLPIQALAAVTISCTASDGAVITVTGDIPENAVVTADPVQVELEGMKTLGAYDINITVDGAAWQPESPVEVSIESPAFEGYEELSVFHVDTDQALDYIDQYFGFLEQIMNFIKGLFSWKISSDEVSFMAEHFSIYAVGTYYVATYNFYDGPVGTGNMIQNATQILKEGEAVQLPAAPAGDGIFQGWYIDGTTPLDGSYQVPELSADVTYNVYPQFAGVCYVTFYDSEGGAILGTVAVGQDGVLSQEEIDAIPYVPQSGTVLTGWKTADGTSFAAGTQVTGDLSVYPVTEERTYVTFDSQGGTPVDMAPVNTDGTVTEPADPYKAGFTFLYWSANVGGSAFDFRQPVGNVTTLYAVWQATGTTYTIAYWAENADDDGYSYVKSESGSGVAGETISLTSNQRDPQRVMDEGQYFAYERADANVVIRGDGSAIINVYFSRNEYTLTFREYKGGWISGYWQTVATITAKYNASIASEFAKEPFSTTYKGRAWKDTGSTYDYALQTLDRMPGTDVTFRLYDQSSNRLKTIYYYVEKVDDNATGWGTPADAYEPLKEVKTYFNYATYEEEYHEIQGFTRFSASEAGFRNSQKDFDRNNTLSLYYTRNSYNLEFYNHSGVVADMTKTVKYGADLSKYFAVTPQKPAGLPANYEFGGWYTSPNCVAGSEVANTLTTMPAGNVVVYAKWSAPEVTVTVHYRVSGGAQQSLKFTYGHELRENELPGAEDMGGDAADFLGWYTKDGEALAEYVFGNQLTSDVTLYARWKGDVYTVTYQGNGSQSFQDSQKYGWSSQAKVLGYPAEWTTPGGESFLYWTDGSKNYYPNDTVTVNGNVTLTAVYGKNVTVEEVTVTYNANGGTGDDVTTEAMPVNSEFEAMAYPHAWTAPTGYKFKEWNTAADGSGEVYAPYEEFRADAGSNVLYAQYEVDESQKTELSYTVEYYKDGEKADTETVTKSVWVGSNKVPVESGDINTTDKYVGYDFEKTDPETLPESVAANSVIKVYYVKDLTDVRDLSYTVEYYKDGVKVDADTETVTKSVWVGSNKVPVESGDINTTDKYVGYDFEKTDPETLPESVAANSVIKVYYVKDLTDVRDLSYTVEYYKDGVKVDADTETVTKSVWVGSNKVPVESGDINTTDKYVGYDFEKTDPETLPESVAANSVIKVYYVKDLTDVRDLSYTVEYYKDGVKVDADTETVTKSVWVGSNKVPVESGDINTTDKYVGYDFEKTDPETLPESVAANSVIKVYYVKDLTDVRDLSYTVEYYKDGVKVDADTETVTKSVWVGSNKVPVESGDINTTDKYVGYDFEKTDPETLPESVAANSVIKVYYVKDLTDVRDLSYTVEYYKDGVKVDADTETVTKSVWVGSNKVPVESGDINTTDKYVGYDFEKTDPETLPESVAANSVIKVYYVKDLTDVRDLSYTVEYYKDGVKVDADTETVTKSVWVGSNKVPVESGDINTTDKYVGYDFEKTDPETLPESVAANSVIKVYYVKDLTDVRDLSYTVEYYKDGVKVDADTETVTKSVWVGSNKVPVESGDINTTDKYVGYDFEKTDPETLPESVAANSVIKVYYVKDLTDVRDLSYTVEYYKDGVKVDADTETVTKSVWVGSNKVPVESGDINTTDKYVGYDFEKTDPETLPESVAANSVIKVYYVKDLTDVRDLSYTVEYYKDGVKVDADTETVTKSVWVGSNKVPVESGDINTTDKYVGYDFEKTDPETLPESVAANSVIKVYYVKDLTDVRDLSYTVEYYKDGVKVDADTETVTKSVWVGSNKVPVESGDINTTDKYVGYDFEKTDPETLPESVAANSVIKVYYVKDLTDVRDLSYTVEYRVGSEDGELLASETVTVEIWVNDSTYMVNSVPEKSFTGYKLAESGSTELPAEVSDGGKIYVIYEKDLSVTKTLSYTVEYYKDGVKVDADTETVEEKVWINSTQTTLTVDKNKINTTDKYEGFALDYTDPAVIPVTIESGSIIKVYYAKDVKGNENDPDEGDGIPDKYQVFVMYEAKAGGSLTGETYKAYDLRDADAEGNLATSVELTFPTPVAETNYVFDGWTNPTDVKVNGDIMSGFKVDTTYTFTANFAKDDLVDPTEDEDPDKPGDGIADKYQVVVNYRAINGTVSFASTAVTKKDASGNPAENGTAKLTNDHIPTTTPNVGYILSNNPWAPATPGAGMEVKNGDTFTITYVLPHPYIPPVDPGTDIDDPDVPLADLPGLNTVDHYAYIAGYEDGTVRPNNNITRAEVATIFFRLFTDEYRETYWSTNNPFSDVAYTAWYNNAVSTTSNAGIIAGYPDGTFQPNNYITRAEFATIAARFLSEEYVGPDLFTDISGHWAAEYINRAANAGWINGYPDGSFRPNAYITRAEAMTLVNSMLGRMPHKDHMLENMVKWPDNPEAAWYYEAVQEATNGHDYDWYEEEDQLFYEIWTALQPNRDWAALEKEWSNAYSAPGGEVIG